MTYPTDKLTQSPETSLPATRRPYTKPELYVLGPIAARTHGAAVPGIDDDPFLLDDSVGDPLPAFS